MSVRVTGEVVRRANVYGQIVEYHQVIHKRTANHIDNVMSAEMLRVEMNYQLNSQGVDGWCDEVVVIQRARTDDVYFSGYIVATEPASPQLVIPLWAIIAFIVAAAAVIAFGMWLIYDFFSAVLEKALPTSRYIDKYGNTTTSFTEYVTLQRLYYWLVCPKCGMGFADKDEYPAWEMVPQDIKDAYDEHVTNCQGITPPPAYPWLVPVIIGGFVVIVVGSVWTVSQIFVKEAPSITVYR